MRDDRDVPPENRIQAIRRRRTELEFWFWAAREALGLVLRLMVVITLILWLIHGGSPEAVVDTVAKLFAR
ncbi:MAG TPA: hypothetical protein VK778_16980 [Solirubrobacteraceae bacterium]|nr:hypothetical protein [Solirubrobacteraceae bacterium]